MLAALISNFNTPDRTLGFNNLTFLHLNNTRMKNLFLVILLIFSKYCFSQNDKLIASCCSTGEARCTGSAYCSACKNCSGCAYCNSGGSCGVCSGGKRSTSSSSGYGTPNKAKPKNQTNREHSNNYNKQESTVYPYTEMYMVITEKLNVREDAGTGFSIVEALKKNDNVLKISTKGQWTKVKVVTSHTIGYVLSKYIKKM